MYLYDELKKKYNLSEKFPVVPFEEEKLMIKEYQTTKDQNKKQRVIDFFWEANKSRIVQQAIKIYSYLQKSFHGDMNLTIDDLIQKGFMAIPHCLKIYHVVDKKKNETEKAYKKRKAIILETRFGTLLQWWIRPFMLQHINRENFIIYVPHSKDSETKSVSLASLDSIAYDNSPKTKADFIKSDDPSPEEICKKEMFWDEVRTQLTPEEYDFLIHWIFLKSYFDNKKQFYEHYKVTYAQTKVMLKKIYAKLKVSLKDYN